tara:strand:- start:43 stop:486 length:444 start_codon:yes stop_codon:yes gene_type:complete
LNKFIKLKNRIKKHEGFRDKVYHDQLGYPTIGYGHLIKKSENFLKNKKYSKKYLDNLFEKDFKIAVINFNKYYKKKKLSKNLIEVLIEMIFQLGIKNLIKFKKFNQFIIQKQLYLAALEMMDSLWYLQTPNRVEELIKILLGTRNDK